MSHLDSFALPQDPISLQHWYLENRNRRFRVCVTVPGLLVPAIEQRYQELYYKAFSPLAIELITFDLRVRQGHWVTQPFSVLPQNEQDAIDQEIVLHYKPGSQRTGALIRALRKDAEEHRFCNQPPAGLTAETYWISFPRILWPLLQIRWRELEYEGASAYLTGLIRYDLMLSGPHKHYDGTIMDPELCKALDQKTVRSFYRREARKIYLDFLVEEQLGAPLSEADREKHLRNAGSALRDQALARVRRG